MCWQNGPVLLLLANFHFIMFVFKELFDVMTTGLALNNMGSWGFHQIAINHRMRGKLRDGRWKSPWSTRVFFKDQETTRTPGTYRSQMRVLDLGLEVLLVVSCHGDAGS